MDIKRNLLLIALAVVSYLMLLAWNRDYPAQTPASATADASSRIEAPAGGNNGDGTTAPATNDTPTVSGDLPSVASQSDTAVDVSDTPAATDSDRYVTVTTPTQVVTIDLVGGDIVELTLPQFPVSMERQDDPFILLNNQRNSLYVAQSGLIGTDGPDASEQGRPRYSSSRSSYVLDTGELSVDLSLTTDAGVDITKRYIFDADDYLINIEYLIDNTGQNAFRANLFGQIRRNDAPDPSTSGVLGMSSFLGAVLNSPDDPYIKRDFDDIEDGTEAITMDGGWIGFSQHYFLSSWVPDASTSNRFTTRVNNNGIYLMEFVGAEHAVAPGDTYSITTGFWAGPKDQYRLEEIHDDLGLTIDYGKMWFIAYPIFWVLSQIYDAVGNYGLAIVLLTLLIRVLFYPLSVKQFKSQAGLKRIQPKVAQLKEKYGEDKQKFMQAQMELWKKENVNPFSGCLPVLMQMPFFIGIFWVLRESVEIRQAPFILWYNDLSAPDPYFVLPILLSAVYFLQQHMTPMMTTDPTQAKVMKFMPVMFGVFFLWFPAGLVLYSLVNALTGIIQQWYFLRKGKEPKTTK